MSPVQDHQVQEPKHEADGQRVWPQHLRDLCGTAVCQGKVKVELIQQVNHCHSSIFREVEHVPNAIFLSEEQTSDYSCLKMQMWTKKWTYEGGY